MFLQQIAIENYPRKSTGTSCKEEVIFHHDSITNIFEPINRYN